jgi:hypothetical protein
MTGPGAGLAVVYTAAHTGAGLLSFAGKTPHCHEYNKPV